MTIYVLDRCVPMAGPLPTPCQIWTGALSASGYSYMRDGRKLRRGHVVAWEQANGRPAPLGLEPDHLCRNRACCAAEHLEWVTHRENILRGDTLPARNLQKKACDRGHAFTTKNTYIRPGTNDHRACRICKAANQARVRGAQRNRAVQSKG